MAAEAGLTGDWQARIDEHRDHVARIRAVTGWHADMES